MQLSTGPRETRRRRTLWVGNAPDQHPLLRKLIHGHDLDELCELADKAGLSRATVRLWWNGTTHCPRLSSLTKVAKVLGLELRLLAVH